MDKMWVLKTESGYTVGKYTNYDAFIRSIKKGENRVQDLDVYEYELKSKTKSSDIINSINRDIKIRQALGSLTKEESTILHFIKAYEHTAPEGGDYKYYDFKSYSMVTIKFKQKMLNDLKSCKTKSAVIKIIKENFKHFFQEVSNDVEWYKAIISFNNFRKVELSGDMKVNFDIAKKELSKSKK